MSSIHVHSERSARTGIAIVWPAWFPGSTDSELHATALFLGNTDTVDFTKADVEEALGRYLWPAWVGVTGTDLFGMNKDIPVLLLERRNTMLLAREAIKRKLEKHGIHASTTFAFNPHVTISKEAEHVQEAATFAPVLVHLEAPVLWWGDERAIHTNHAMQKLGAPTGVFASGGRIEP